MVAEADESDGSFLRLSPVIAVITNVDREHLDHYGDFRSLGAAFVEFANRVPFYGTAVVCLDDGPLASLVPAMTRRVTTYGIDRPDAEVRAVDIRLDADGSRCAVVRRTPGGGDEALGRLRLAVPGRHNLLNALAAVVVGLELDVPFPRLEAALAEFAGAERRFQLIGEAAGVRLVDDYGHHPTEIAAVIDAARRDPRRRIVVVFQPHRYTRTAALLAEFGEVLARADAVVLTDIYPAGEDAIPGVTVDAVAEAVRRRGETPVEIVRALGDLPAHVARTARAGDLVITLGAGSIGSIGERILEALRSAAPEEATR
jgi:UDP-N-acetylmuramate--alanine ligase